MRTHIEYICNKVDEMEHKAFSRLILTMGPLKSSGTIRNDYNVRVTIMNKGSISVVLNSVR